MTITKNTNEFNLKAGDSIQFLNSVNYLVTLNITRVDEKSCYANGRNSWNTINTYIKKYNAKITRA